jgi:hypothetical protein
MSDSSCDQYNTNTYWAWGCQQITTFVAEHNIEIEYSFCVHSYNDLSQACTKYNLQAACGLWKPPGLGDIFSCDSKNALISASDGLTISLKSHEGDIHIFAMPLKREWSTLHTCIVSWWSAQIPASWMKSGSLTSVSAEEMETDFSHFGMWDKSVYHPHDILPWKHRFSMSVCVYSPPPPFCIQD